jgi:cell division protein FtsN
VNDLIFMKKHFYLPNPLHQRGGTLLGLVLGAVLGLGAALAVAVYVTKVPIPFLNKTQGKGPETDAAEAKKNKDWNPNTPLAGKNGVKPAAPASAPASVEVAPAKPAASDPLGDLAVAKTKAEAKEQAKLEAKLAKEKSDLEAKEKAEAKALAKAKAEQDAKKAEPLPDLPTFGTTNAAAGADPFNYFVQAGAFRTAEDAEQQRAKLSLLGFQAKVTEREQSGRAVFRVRLGPFDKKDDADKAKEKLEGNSIDTALVRIAR